MSRILAADRSVLELYEPFNPGAREMALLRYPKLDFTTISTTDPGMRRAVSRLLGLKLSRPRISREARSRSISRDIHETLALMRARFRQTSLIIKDPNAAHLAGWLSAEFGVRPIALVRHPCGNAAGYLRVGWSGVRRFLEWPIWVAQVAPEDRDYLLAQSSRAKGDPVLSAALAWRATNGVLLRLQAVMPVTVVTRYEDLVAEPTARFASLAAQVGLPWGRANVDLLANLRGAVLSAESLGSRPRVLKRDSRSTADSWRERLTSDEIDRTLRHAGPLADVLGYEA